MFQRTANVKVSVVLVAMFVFCFIAMVSAQTLVIPVSKAEDDQEQYIDGANVGQSDPGSSDLELGIESGGLQIVGVRFQVPIPKGATITNAYIEFEADEVGASKNINPCLLTIWGQASDNAPVFLSAKTPLNDVSDRVKTTASATWSPTDWMVEHEKQNTSDIKSIVQEIVNRSGWVSGNSMVFVITGTGKRYAEAYEGEVTGAPILHVTYTTGGTAVEEKATTNLPSAFSLRNYPNPFNPSTKIHYNLPAAGQVRMAVYDMTGREVSMLVNEMQKAGSYELVWNPAMNGTSLTSGTYFCRLQTGSTVQTIKMLYVK